MSAVSQLIEHLQAENERLRAALSIFLATDETMEGILWDAEPDSALMKITVSLGKYREARAALAPSAGECKP